MKLRRLVTAVIVLGGVLLLALGLAGVFTPERPTSPPLPRGPDKAGASDDTGAGIPQPVIKSFRVEDDEGKWVLTGTRAEGGVGEGQEIRLENPALETRLPAGKEEDAERVSAGADLGVFIPEPERRVEMSGNVRVELVGRETVLLQADSLSVELDTEVLHTNGPLRLVSTTEEGRQTLSGRGARVVVKERSGTIFEDVRMELSGVAEMFPSVEGESEEVSAPAVTRITCRGPCVADEFKRSMVLDNDVVLRQGESELRAQRVEVFFPDKGRKPKRFVATGGVSFQGAGSEGRCDRLVHVAADRQIVLEGSPAVVSQGANEIKAERIELELAEARRVFVPGGGQLTFVQAAEKETAPQELLVRWKGSMRFRQDKGEAAFRDGVRFSYNDQEIECQRLSVHFDEESRQLVSARAEGGVRLHGQLGALSEADKKRDAAPVAVSGKEMLYDAAKETVEFRGDVLLQQGGQTVRGERIALNLRDHAIHTAGAGSLKVRQEAASGDRPLEVAWAGEMRFSRKSGEGRFQRGVRMLYGGRRLSAERVTAQIGDDDRLQGFEATERVVVEEETAPDKPVRTLRASKVTADIGANNVLNEFSATENVVITEDDPQADTSRTLRADRVDARIAEGEAVERFDAFGNVIFEQDKAVAKGDKLIWNVNEGDGTLTGSPVRLEMERSHLSGEKIEFDRQRGRIRITSNTRVEARLVTAARGRREILPR